MTPDFRSRLADRFRKQQQFAEGYSPLYAALFGVVGDWLADDEEVAAWLVEAAQPRQPLDVTLLLAAGIHREVLRGTAAALAPYFSTIHQAPLSPDTEFPAVLSATILAHRDRLAGFIQRANVQTNETGRGTVWLLPVACLGWPAVQSGRMHITVDVFSKNYRPAMRRAVTLISDLLALGFFGLITWTIWKLALKSVAMGEISAGYLSFPVYPFKLFCAVGATLTVIVLLIQITRLGAKSPEEGKRNVGH